MQASYIPFISCRCLIPYIYIFSSKHHFMLSRFGAEVIFLWKPWLLISVCPSDISSTFQCRGRKYKHMAASELLFRTRLGGGAFFLYLLPAHIYIHKHRHTCALCRNTCIEVPVLSQARVAQTHAVLFEQQLELELNSCIRRN